MKPDQGHTEQRLREAFTASEPLTRDWHTSWTPAPSASPTTDQRPVAWRRWQAPLLAAAIVAAVVVATTITLTHRHTTNTPRAVAAHSRTAATTRSASGSQSPASTSPTSPPAPVIIQPGQTAHLGPPTPQVGVAYPFDLLTHCGITATMFGGRGWQAVHPQPEPPRRPDSHGITHYTGYTAGTATLTSPSTLTFTVHDPESTADGQSYTFTPATKQQPICA